MATFITSKAVGQTITITVTTSTGYWKYNHNGSDSSVFSTGAQTVTVTNANGEFTIISCLSDGTVSGNITVLNLSGLKGGNNQITTFDGTGLSSLTTLFLSNNQLTEFNGTGLSGLTNLSLTNNPLTTFIGGDMGLITSLDFRSNLGGWNITTLESIDISGMDILQYLYITNNSAINTPPVNNTLLAKLAANELANDWEYGEFYTAGGRYASATADYDYLIANGWDISGVELTLPVTFITSKAVGETITIFVETSTGYWKYNHNGSDSSVFENGSLGGNQTITVANANGEFTIIPCLNDGTVSGDIIFLESQTNQITSFDGTGLSSLTGLDLSFNQLTSFDGTDLTSLTQLYLFGNQLTSFDGTDLTSLTYLNLGGNQLTSFDGTDLTALTELYLENNQLTSINISGLNVLQYLYVNDTPLTPSINNSLLAQLAANELANDWDTGQFSTQGGRTSAGTTDYDYLIANGWTITGADLVVVGSGKLRIKGVTTGI